MKNTFADFRSDTRNAVRDILVTHVLPDLDALISLWVLESALGAKYRINPKVVFVSTRTYQNMRVYSGHEYDLYDANDGLCRVWHVDTGGGALDHHHDGSGNRSACEAVVKACGLYKVSHFRELVRQVNLADQGKSGAPLSLVSVIRGLHENGMTDIEIYSWIKPAFPALLTNAKHWVDGQTVEIKQVPSFSRPLADGLLAEHVPFDGFGNIGLVCAPSGISRAIVARLWKEFDCRVVVVINLSENVGEYPTIGILTNNQYPVDLAGLGIVKAIRKKEAQLRGIELAFSDLEIHGDIPGMNWFAFCPEGSGQDGVSTLLNGSEKHPNASADVTRIPWPDLMGIVKQCVHNFVNRTETTI